MNQKKPEPTIPPSLSQHIEEIMRRLRLLEERYSGLRKKTQYSEENMLKDSKNLEEDIQVLNESLMDIKRGLSEMDEKMARLEEEVSNSVSKSDLNTVSKYLDFWQPLNFLTRKEAEELIRQLK